jgi:hypothetical protein
MPWPSAAVRSNAVEPAQAVLGLDVEDDGQVRTEVGGGPSCDVLDLGQLEDPSTALVGQQRVDVAVGDHHLAALERRHHQGVDVLGLVGGVQQDLRAMGQLAGCGVQHDAPQLLADRGVAGLEREQGAVSARVQSVGQGTGLRRLPRALAALEADEDAGGGVHAACLSSAPRRTLPQRLRA